MYTRSAVYPSVLQTAQDVSSFESSDVHELKTEIENLKAT